MTKPETPTNEAYRLKSLKDYSVLDTLPEEDYDNITRLASQICNTPIALISLIDEKRQWFKSHHGLSANQTPREFAFCAHAINNPNETFRVNDSTKDERFYDNPLVTGDPNVIFYTGVPLVTPTGFAIGTICVIDNKPNSLDDTQETALKSLSNIVINLFELRKNKLALEETQRKLEAKNHELEQFARVAAHDLKSPLNAIISIADLIEAKHIEGIGHDLKNLFRHIKGSSQQLSNLVTGILEHSKSEQSLLENRTEINLPAFIQEITSLIDYSHHHKINYSKEERSMEVNKVALQQIFINLLTNSIKYNDKELVEISISITESDLFYIFSITDNGQGISEDSQQRIFNIFSVESHNDRFGNRGNGIGLATVKSLVEGLGGQISVKSIVGESTTFNFTIKK